MFYAIRYGRGKAPMWVTTLRLAERWHVLPSDVERMPGGLKWANRQSAIDEVDARIAKIESKK